MIAAPAFFSTSTRRARKKREWELGRAGEDNFPQITLTELELWSSSPREQLSGIVSRWPRVLGQFPPPAASASRGLKGFLSFLSLFLSLFLLFLFYRPSNALATLFEAEQFSRWESEERAESVNVEMRRIETRVVFCRTMLISGGKESRRRNAGWIGRKRLFSHAIFFLPRYFSRILIQNGNLYLNLDASVESRKF